MNAQFYYEYFSSRIASKWAVLFVDGWLVTASMLCAVSLQLGVSVLFSDLPFWAWTIFLSAVCHICFFYFTKTYRGVLRYSSFIDIVRLFVSLTLAYVVIYSVTVFGMLYGYSTILSGRIILTAYLINFSLMVGLRILVKLLYEQAIFDRERGLNVFIFGHKGAGINIAKSLRVNRGNHFRLRGFISDDPGLIDKQTMGCRVYANGESLFSVLSKQKIEVIIVPPEKVRKLETTGMIERLIAMDIRVLTVPPLNDWREERESQLQIVDIRIEDLLQRDSIQVDLRKISSCIEGSRVMITGAAGSIGREMVRQIATFNPLTLILIDQAESPLHNVQLEMADHWKEMSVKVHVADVTNRTRMESIFNTYRPQYVLHAAAYKQVSMMEDNVSEAVQVNVLGTRIVADLSVKYGADKFVMISTDQAVRPASVVGCSKRLAETYVHSLAKKLLKGEEGEEVTKTALIITRFGNVLDFSDSIVPRFKQQIERGGPVIVTHPDDIRYFMASPEACQLVLEASCMGDGRDIYLFDMGSPVKIYDLAKRMIYLSGRREVKIEFSGLKQEVRCDEGLLNVKECTCPTYHEKIRIANVCEYDFDEIEQKIIHLIELSYKADPMQIVLAMKELMPEFAHENLTDGVLQESII